jgi:hypothetical protein
LYTSGEIPWSLNNNNTPVARRKGQFVLHYTIGDFSLETTTCRTEKGGWMRDMGSQVNGQAFTLAGIWTQCQYLLSLGVRLIPWSYKALICKRVPEVVDMKSQAHTATRRCSLKVFIVDISFPLPWE